MLYETFLLAQREIRRNALRSTLTVLGIVIGVAAVITMVTLGGGATAKVTSDISKLGSNLLQVRPGQGFRGPGGARTEADPFEVADALAISKQIPGVRSVAPAQTRLGQVIYGHQNRSSTVYGTTNGFVDARDWELAAAGHLPKMNCGPVKPSAFWAIRSRRNFSAKRNPWGPRCASARSLSR